MRCHDRALRTYRKIPHALLHLRLPDRPASRLASGFGALRYVAISAGLWMSLPIGMAAAFASVHGQGAVLGGVGVAVAFSTGTAAANRMHVSCMRVVVTIHLRHANLRSQCKTYRHQLAPGYQISMLLRN